jgi:hypothetical protein
MSRPEPSAGACSLCETFEGETGPDTVLSNAHSRDIGMSREPHDEPLEIGN